MLGVALMLVAAVMLGAEAKTAACRRKKDEGERSQRKPEDAPTLKPPQEVPEEECRQGNCGGGSRAEVVGIKKQGAGAKAKAEARRMGVKRNGARGGRSRRRKLPRRKEEWHDAATRRRAARSARART